MHDIKINLATLNLSGLAASIINSIDDVRDHNFLAKGLASVPLPLQSRLARKYIERYDENAAQKKFKANTWFYRTINKLKPRWGVLFSITQNMPLPWYILSNKEKTKNHASTKANECAQAIGDLADELAHLNYEDQVKICHERLGELAQEVGVTIQHWHNRDNETIQALEIAIRKTTCEKWWATKLKTVRARYLELLEISTGQVGKDLYYSKPAKNSKGSKNTIKQKEIKRKGISPYSSKQAQREYYIQQQSGKEYLSRLELENKEGDVIDLTQAVEAGMANPVNRRNELMLRMRETEEIAKQKGYVPMFYTGTCPSKYHPNSDKWNGATPKDAQNYLTRTWARSRSKLARLGIEYFGIRVAEPHADGCPHWHMLLFIPKNRVQWVTAILRKYFIAEDTEELYKRYGALTNKLKQSTYTTDTTNGVKVTYQEYTKPCRHNEERRKLFKTYLQKRSAWGFKKSQGIKAKAPEKFYRTFAPRFTAVKIDPEKGSAAGYIAKYISKNIDGYQVTDHEDAETGENIQVNPVLAWASTWGIRQFQFQKSPSVTVYRELRRVREPVEQPDIERIRQAADQGEWAEFVNLMGGMGIGRNANFTTAYETTPHGNKYDEAVKRIKGVSTNTSYTAQALRELKGEISVFNDASLITRITQWVKQLKGTAAKNKAEGVGFAEARGLSWTSGNNCTPCTTTTSDMITHVTLSLSPFEIQAIKKGQRIVKKDLIYQLKNNQIQVFEKNDQRNQQQKAEITHFASIYARKASRTEPNLIDREQAKALVATAFNHASNNGRTLPGDHDWQYAHNVANGTIQPDWWD